ncbi:hypothetical protein TNIN_439581 [Trichonephila inaurata madagascariensis]|uniref:Uncharacterized protein n=1 Tax=Trichonephila inaurata madagascariensis TaxID=2747483 RepID=A0A8X6XDP5_9ARAC|nr:hypothetical protein TNIN_439581 [Trichonephila inaurata madagascariensis]
MALIYSFHEKQGTSFWYKKNALRGYAPRVGLAKTPIPGEVFDAVEDKQFENSLTDLTVLNVKMMLFLPKKHL